MTLYNVMCEKVATLEEQVNYAVRKDSLDRILTKTDFMYGLCETFWDREMITEEEFDKLTYDLDLVKEFIKRTWSEAK